MHDLIRMLRATPLHPEPAGRWLRPNYSADVSVVIVNYNSRAMLERTLTTLIESHPHSTVEIIVVDNGSHDGSIEMVRSQFPHVRLLAQEQNLGLVRANNLGMALANGRYLLQLNNDMIVFPNMIDALVDYLDKHSSVGAAGCKVLNIDGTIQGTVKAHPTPLAALFGRHSPITRWFPANRFSRRYLVYMNQDFSHPFAAGSVSSCAIMVRREAIELAGPMDERFFVYWSDVDWCRAIWEAGYEVHCVPASVIIHDEHKGGTRANRRRSQAAVIDFHRGAYLYYRKWHIPHTWHPSNALAAMSLAGRAAFVLAVEYIRWARRERRSA